MKNLMLIDAKQSEDTRVVVVRNGRVDEFDIASKSRHTVKGNIYLALVTRVEPSLQAAFVDFGGGKNGFLSFNEIHPDYYNIPAADRELLLAEEMEQGGIAHIEEFSEHGVVFGGAEDDTEDDIVDIVAVGDDVADDTAETADDADVLNADANLLEEAALNVAEHFAAHREEHHEDDAAKQQELGDSPRGRVRRHSFMWQKRSQAAEAEQRQKRAEAANVGTHADTQSALDDSQDVAASDQAATDNHEFETGGDNQGASAAGALAQETNGEYQIGVGHNQPPQDGDSSPQDEHQQQSRAASEAAAEQANGDDVSGEASGEGAPLAAGYDEAGEHAGDANNGGAGAGADSGDRSAAATGDAPRARSRRRYKIQEVIKRGSVLLVQVTKDERGNKGAALTTYLSLAGRYCVLMPQISRGVGVSRKITNPATRRRLQEIVSGLGVPERVGLIVRTAGAERTKAEIKRDYEYMARMWDGIRETTISAQAPCLIHEEGDIIHRAVRDLYGKGVDGVLVAGGVGYEAVRRSMKMLMPSHVRNVKQWDDATPLFAKQEVEQQLMDLMQPKVALPSGGYLVINQTEALVAVDVNSGRSTKEHNFEDTALHTNLEAAREVGRQLRLRDLAGLIVVDFIDMRTRRNNSKVERELKHALSSDRARVQVGRISAFGLLEMSRQRLRASIAEEVSEVCPSCNGSGRAPGLEYRAMVALRNLQINLVAKPGKNLQIRVAADVAAYLLNAKREDLLQLEQSFGVGIEVTTGLDVASGCCEVEVTAAKAGGTRREPAATSGGTARRSRQGRRGAAKDNAVTNTNAASTDNADIAADDTVVAAADDASVAQSAVGQGEAEHQEDARTDDRKRSRRRGRRSRGRRGDDAAQAAASEADGFAASEEQGSGQVPSDGDNPEVTPEAGAQTDQQSQQKSSRRSPRRRSRARSGDKAVQSQRDGGGENAGEARHNQPEAAPLREQSQAADTSSAAVARSDDKSADDMPKGAASSGDVSSALASHEAVPAKRGWWRRVVS